MNVEENANGGSNDDNNGVPCATGGREQTPWMKRYERLGSLVRSRDDAQKLRIMLEGRVRLRVAVKCSECGHVERHDMLRGEIPKFEKDLLTKAKEACPECKKNTLKVEGVEEPTSYHPALEAALDNTCSIEKALDSAIEAPVFESKLWNVGLKGVKGIGPIMAAELLTTFDPYRAEHASGYWKYAGLHVIERCKKCGGRCFGTAEEKEKWVRIVVAKLRLASERRKGEKKKFNEEEARREAEKCICRCPSPEVVRVAPRRRRGEFAEWNPKARTLAWKVYTQLIMAKGKYAELYRKQKDLELARNEARNPKLRPVIVDLRAKRWMIKEGFLEDLWLCSRAIEGLPVSKPYSVDRLGHHEEEKKFPYFLIDRED